MRAVAAIAVLALSLPGAFAGELDTDPAVLAARSWLSTVDAGQYAESWDDAAETLHIVITRDAWESSLRSVRAPKGAALERKVRRAVYQQSSYNDAGQFVQIEIETRFEKRPGSVETVTASRSRDGTWRVAGYTIR